MGDRWGKGQVPFFFMRGLGKKGLLGEGSNRFGPGLPRHVPPRDATIRAERARDFYFYFYLHFKLTVLPVVVMVVMVVYCDVVTAHPLHSCSMYFVDRRHLLTCQEARVQVPERQGETGQTPRLGRSSTSIYILKRESLGDEQVPLKASRDSPRRSGGKWFDAVAHQHLYVFLYLPLCSVYSTAGCTVRRI